MKQPNPIPPKHARLLALFLNGYEPMRQKMDEPCRRPLLEIAPLVFGKWCYTALAQETILSPANLLELDLKQEADDQTEYAYVMRTKSEEALTDTDSSAYSFALFRYTTEEHPLIDDLKALIRYCTPDRAADAEGLLLAEEKEGILQQLTLKTDFYLEYLTRLAWTHGLLVSMPAIHTKRMRPAAECEAFFAQPTEEILFQLAESACMLAAERFAWSMDLEDDIAPTDFFYGLLRNHTEVDKIFVDFYKRVDINIEDIWKKSPETLDAEEHSIVSSFLFTGILLDKWFLTPMSVFFRFIRPIAYTPMHFYQLVNHLSSLVLMEHNLGAEIFTPPTYYSLTAIGQKLFADPEHISVDRQKMPRTVPYEYLMSAVEQEFDLRMQERMLMMEIVPDVLSIKVSLVKDEALWKVIEVGQNMSVHTICSDLCSAFSMEEMADYLLTVPDQNGFPLAYSARGSKRSINKTNTLNLQELPLEVGSKLMLYPSHNKATTLSLEILEKGKGNPYLLYPRVIRQSEKVIEQEKMDELF